MTAASQAQALLHWGRPRFTEDLDVTVLAGSVDTAQLVAGLGEHGFELRLEATPPSLTLGVSDLMPAVERLFAGKK